jgi:putative transposase
MSKVRWATRIKRQKHKHYTIRFRFVTLYNEELGQWHRYVTNLPTTMMKARHFSSVYAARWEVELLFRELKSVYRIDQMPSGNRHVTETLIYAALLTLTLNRRLYRELIRRHKLDPQRLPLDRWAILFAAVADELLVLSLHRRDRTWRARRIQSFFRAEATDPNRARIPLPYRAQQGLYLRA